MLSTPSPQLEDGGSMDLRSVGILPQHYKLHNPEELDLSFHRRENLKSR
jgi:hypothetical protein